MVQIPTYEARVGLDAPSYPVPRVDDSVGQALRSAGSAIASLGDHIKQKEKRTTAFNTAISYDRLNEELSQGLIEAERNAPANGQGLHDTFVDKTVTPKTDAFLSSIQDPDLKKEYEARLGLLRDKWSNDAANKQYGLSNGYSQNAVNDAWKTRAQGIADNPVQVAAYTTEMNKLIDNAPDLTSAQREDMKRKINDSAPGIVAEALKQRDPETFYFATGNGTHDERIAFLTKRLTPAVEAAGRRPVGKEDASRLQGLVNKYDGDAEAALIAYQAGPEAADKWLEKGRDYAALPDRKVVEPYVQGVLSAIGTAKLASGTKNVAPQGDTLQTIRNFESFRSTAYWDVNAWRTGFGSDTVTRADGSVERVTRDTVVTREDAERDLARRTKEFQKGVISQIGADTWKGLSSGAQAALTSVAYNYGSLPASVAAAARTGAPAAIAAAIRDRAGDNGGVNRDRRAREAAIAMGGGVPAGQMVATKDSPVPVDGNRQSGFVSSAFSTMPVANLFEAKASAADLRVKEVDQQRQAKEQRAVESANLVSSDLTSIAQTGKGAITPTDFETTSAKILETLGPQKHDEWLQSRQIIQRTYDLTADTSGLSNTAMRDRLLQIKPKGGPTAAMDQEVYNAVAKRYDEEMKLRVDDPGLAAQQVPEIKATAATMDWSQPAKVQEYLGQVEAAQAMLQIPDRNLLPKAQAEQLGVQFRNVLRANAGSEAEATKAFLDKLQSVYGNYADDIFTQSYETILEKDISKETKSIMSSVVLDWAQDKPGMIDQRLAVANELAAADKQPDLVEPQPQPQGRSLWGWLTGAPPVEAPKPAAPKPTTPQAPPRAVTPITIDGVPPDAIDAVMKNPNSMKIQSMFRNIYGADRLKDMQKQLRARGIIAAQ